MQQWFLPERPGPLVWAHVVQTGHGRCLVDRWPNPRTVVAQVADNYSLPFLVRTPGPGPDD
ncbi:MAG TPA: hypothetical protein VFA63_08835 [Pseudonocardiaceae bacterium]|nr:hypothetical protein [Pseudonocardiaceae bacterium]